MSAVLPTSAKRVVELTIDGKPVRVLEGTTLLDACRSQNIATPTLCYLENLTPVNVCRVCVVEVEGSRTLVPACSRTAENGMVVQTDSDRVRLSRRLVLELLASSVDLSIAPAVSEYLQRYGAHPERFGLAAASSTKELWPHCTMAVTRRTVPASLVVGIGVVSGNIPAYYDERASSWTTTFASCRCIVAAGKLTLLNLRGDPSSLRSGSRICRRLIKFFFCDMSDQQNESDRDIGCQ